jgi:hypothetical protein
LVLDGPRDPSYNGKDEVGGTEVWDRGADRVDDRAASAHRPGGSVQPTSLVSNVVTPRRATGRPLFVQGRQAADPASFVTRGPLAARAHRLLGLGAAGSARLGSSQRSMTAAFGGDVATYHRTATPWIAARSLARPTDSLPAQSSVAWLLGSKR